MSSVLKTIVPCILPKFLVIKGPYYSSLPRIQKHDFNKLENIYEVLEVIEKRVGDRKYKISLKP